MKISVAALGSLAAAAVMTAAVAYGEHIRSAQSKFKRISKQR